MTDRASHVVMLDGVFTCEHCSARYRMNLPAPINVFVAACEAFTSDHEHCTLAQPTQAGAQLDLLKAAP